MWKNMQPCVDKDLGRLICITTMPVLSTCIQQKGNITDSLSQNFSKIGRIVKEISSLHQIKTRKGEQNSLEFVTSSPISKSF